MVVEEVVVVGVGERVLEGKGRCSGGGNGFLDRM